MEPQDRASRDIFEALWMLRACYPYRSDYDTRGALSVSAAVEYGEGLLRQAQLRERWGFGQRHRAA